MPWTKDVILNLRDPFTVTQQLSIDRRGHQEARSDDVPGADSALFIVDKRQQTLRGVPFAP